MGENKKSIYEIIVSGWLKDAKPGDMGFLNSMFECDAIYAFHKDVEEELRNLHLNGALDRLHKDREAEKQRFIYLFKQYYALPPEKAFLAFENDDAYKTEGVYLLEYVIDHIRKNKKLYDMEKLREIAVLLTTKSVYPDVICFGLYMFSLFKLKPDSKEGFIIRALGYVKFFTHWARRAAKTAFPNKAYQELMFDWVQEISGEDNDNLPHGDFCGHIETELIYNIVFNTKEKIDWLMDSYWISSQFYYGYF